jgi:prephenate dehydratase
VDVIFEQFEEFEKAMEIVKVMTEDLKIFGTYKNSLI